MIAVAVVLVLLLTLAWWVDHRDRRNGHKVKDVKMLGEHIKLARRERRSAILGRTAGRLRPQPPPGGYRQPDGSRKPIKRGQ